MMTTQECEVAVVGAGPYGLAVAGHLTLAGVNFSIFGETMDFWISQMPKGMFLRSPWAASHIGDPDWDWSLDNFAADESVCISKPLPLTDFVRYGRWIQARVARNLDNRRVATIEPAGGIFRLRLSEGDCVYARRVVVAAGIAKFPHRPEQFSGISRSLVSHTADHSDLSSFNGKRVLIVGGGQSALENAALLNEAGAEVEVLVRAPVINWLDQRASWLKSDKNPFKSLLYPRTDVGPPVLNQIVATPRLFRLFPESLQAKIARRSIRPAGAGWLVPRMRGVKLSVGRSVTQAAERGDFVSLQLSDGTRCAAGHVMLATGYRVDIARYGFLSSDLLQRIETEGGYPLLKNGFESSVPGLHFVGAPAARSFGPLCRFVAGTSYAARAVAKSIRQQSSRKISATERTHARRMVASR